jgi:hypothetical protein
MLDVRDYIRESVLPDQLRWSLRMTGSRSSGKKSLGWLHLRNASSWVLRNSRRSVMVADSRHGRSLCAVVLDFCV